jgi:hypothetical protein
MRYTVKTNRYFVYPRVSLTTNFVDKGQHVPKSSTSYQVPLMLGIRKGYKFPTFNEESIKYDVFFERVGIGKELGIPEEDLCTDLYGSKQNKLNKRFWITMIHANYKKIFKFGLKLRPHEVNIHYNVQGDEIFCYDTEKIINIGYKPKIANINTLNVIAYEFRDTKRTDIWLMGLVHFSKMIVNMGRKIYRIFKY